MRYVNVPLYDEISVLKLWPIMQQNKEFMMFFPDNLRKGLLPRRDYFFNILNTIDPEYMTSVIDHANKQRHDPASKPDSLDYIEVTEAWYDKLQNSSFVSCKCNE